MPVLIAMFTLECYVARLLPSSCARLPSVMRDDVLAAKATDCSKQIDFACAFLSVESGMCFLQDVDDSADCQGTFQLELLEHVCLECFSPVLHA